MLLLEFPCVVIDELPAKADPDKLYFLSRPIHNTVKYDDNNQILILTSEEIRGFMRRGTNRIRGDFIVAFPDAVFQIDGREIKVHMIKTGSICGDVMFLFEYSDEPNKKTLYTGAFNEYMHAFDDEYLKASIKNHSIECVYIDNTIASCAQKNSVHVAADAISKIQCKYSDYKIYLWADRLGCENLLELLSTKHRLKIFLNGTRYRWFYSLEKLDLFCKEKSQANIFVLEELQPHRIETYLSIYSDKKEIELRLITTEKEAEPIGLVEEGIVYIPFAQHPSTMMLMSLLKRVRPKKVIKIAEKSFCGYCSDIPVHRLPPFAVEDGNADEMIENPEPLEYHSLSRMRSRRNSSHSFLSLTSSDGTSTNADNRVIGDINHNVGINEPNASSVISDDAEMSQNTSLGGGNAVALADNAAQKTTNEAASKRRTNSEHGPRKRANNGSDHSSEDENGSNQSSSSSDICPFY